MLGIALRNILNHKLKSILVAFGIVVGVCAVVTIFSVGIGGSEQITSLFSSLGLDGLIVSTSGMAIYPQNGIFSDEDITYMLNTSEAVETAMPIITQAAKIGNTAKVKNGYLFGLSNNTHAVAAVTLKYGDTFSDVDIKSGRKVCLVDTDMAKSLYGRENIVGKTVTVQVNGTEEKINVSGVISSDSAIGTIINSYASNVIFLPYTTLCNISGANKYSGIALSIAPDSDIDSVKDNLTLLVNDYMQTDNVTVQNMSAQKDQMESVVNWITGILSAVAGVSVVVGGSGIMSVMLSSVSERKKEIGIKLAVGATSKRIKAEFISEAVLLSLISGIVGLLLSIYAIKFIGSVIGIPLSLKLSTAIYALLFCLIIGIIFSVYPASKASKLNPIECLRNE